MDKTDYLYIEDPEDPDGWKSDPFRGHRFEPPIGDVTDEPRKCVEIASEWVPYIIGALDRLKFGDMWNADEEDMQRILGNINTLQSQLAQGDCDGGNLDYECGDFPLHAPNIDWLPADPFHEPGEIPPGYSLPPFVIAEVDEPLNGIRAGDVLIGAVGSLISFPPIVPLSGVPRLQITVQGPATLDVGFARVLQGGIAVVLVDGLPNHWVDLQLYNVADLLNVNSWAELFGFAINTFTGAKLQDEIELSEDREYIVEIQFFPRPAFDYSLGYGGGIRSIEICSAKEQIDVSGIVQDVRINNGTIEKFIEGLWESVEVSDGNDVLTENELRADGCQLQAYDLQSGEWVDVPDAKFYRTDEDCPILHTVNIVPGSDGYHLQIDSAGTPNAAMVGAFGATGFFRGTDAATLLNASGASVTVAGSDFAYVKDAGGGAPNFGMFNVVASGAKVPLVVTSQHSAPTALQRWYNYQSKIMAEVSAEGWFSAIQQLIVSDFTTGGTKRSQGRILGQWFEPTDSIRSGRIITQVDDHTGVHEAMRAEASVGETRLSFFGNAAVPRQNITSTEMAAIVSELLEAFDDFGLITNSTGFDNASPIEEPAFMDTYYEAYWDWENNEPAAQEWGIVEGLWVDEEGVTQSIVGDTVILQMSRLIWEKNKTFDWRFIVNVASLTGGDVHVKLQNSTGGIGHPDSTFIIGEGITAVIFPVNRFGENDRFDFTITCDMGETCDVAITAMWERGLHLPVADRVLYANEVKIHTGLPDTYDTPSA